MVKFIYCLSFIFYFMKNLKILISFLLFFSPLIAYSNFWSISEVNSDKSFSKFEWVKTLYVKQKKYINPFSGKTITRQLLNGVFQWYTIDWVFFNSNYSLWKYRNSDWSPNQKVLTWEYKEKVYKYDITKPGCWSVKLYDSNNNIIEAWKWVNFDVRARVRCLDVYSWCKPISPINLVWWNVYSNYLNLSHLDKKTPKTTFTDLAWNSNTCSSSIKWNNGENIKVLIDQRLPKIDFVKFSWSDISYVNSFKAWKNSFTFSFRDEKSSNYWVSWIKSYEFRVNYIKDHTWVSKNEEVCSSNKVYPSYNSSWNKTTIDRKNESADCFGKLNKVWTYRVTLTIKDYAWNENNVSYDIVIYPNDDKILSNLELIPSSSYNSKYANNSDFYTYRLTLEDKYGNPIYKKDLNYLNQEWSQTGFVTIKTNMLSNSWYDSLIENYSWKTNNSWEINFIVKSLTPWKFSESFRVKLNKWNSNYSDLSSLSDFYVYWIKKNSFKKPFTAKLGVWSSWNESLILSKNQNAKLTVSKTNCSSCSSYTISNFKNSFTTTWNWFVVESTKNERSLINSNPNLDFILNHDWESDFDISKIGIKTTPYISYVISWKTTKYLLSETDSPSDINAIKYEWWKFFGLLVVWNLQWQWKQTVTWQQENFSDLSKFDLRVEIKKNANELTRWLNSNTELNWIKYVKWDYSITSSPSGYETLIVDWNLTIKSNINNNIWIIVLNWDIKIENNVSDIKAIIYSDWAIFSDWGWEKQLRITWSLFTSNTIGWALWTPWNYLLPGGGKTSDYDLAKKYDLNFLRVWNLWWDKNGNSIEDNWEYKYASTVVIFNSENQINPPKWFSK